MKRFAILGALVVVGAALIAPISAASGRTLCLQSDRIDRTTPVGTQDILFRMKDGKVYRSHLRTPCLGLKFNGFVYVTPMDEICGGTQSIRVLKTDQVCVLGPFVPDSIGH